MAVATNMIPMFSPKYGVRYAIEKGPHIKKMNNINMKGILVKESNYFWNLNSFP